MLDIKEVSKWFVRNNKDTASYSWDGNVKLQKLLYYAQAMHLAVNSTPLFDDKIEAWENGPVIRSAYDYHRYGGLLNETNLETPGIIGVQEKILNIINYVYGSKSAGQLIDLTHSENPWKSKEQMVRLRGNPEITVEEMLEFYTPLKDIYEAYEDYDFGKLASINLQGNVFTYDKTDTEITEADIELLKEIIDGVEERGSYFIYKDDTGELVVY